MKKCPNCGASMDTYVNFCTNGGTKLIEENINTLDF
ncbi:zinc ribbon domain-containing protein [Lactobacillus johnsonii]